MMFWYGSHWAFWQVGLMSVGMIAFWALLIWAVWAVWAMVTEVTRRPSEPSEPSESSSGNARPILDERLARGEIDVEEYRRLRDAIGSENPVAVGGAK